MSQGRGPIVISLPPNRARVLTLVSKISPEPRSVHDLTLFGQPSDDSAGAGADGPETHRDW